MSMQNSPRLSAPRTGVVALVNLRQPNAWELMNTKGIDVVREQKLVNIPKGRIFTGKEGVIAVLTRSSSKHLCATHSHQVSINDPNVKPKKYPQIKTKISNANELVFGDIIETVMQSPEKIYTDVKIRGVTGHGYFTTDNFGPYNPKYEGFL